MKTKILIASTLTVLGLTAAGAALASNHGEQSLAVETQMLHAAKISLDQAKNIAQNAVPGTVSGVSFNDENGKGVWEADIVDAKKQAYTVKIDAMSGKILSQGLENSEKGGGEGEYGHDEYNQESHNQDNSNDGMQGEIQQ